MRILFMIAAITCSLFSIGQSVQITGSSSTTYGNKPYVLYLIEDAISGRKTAVAEGITDREGNFNIAAELKETSAAIISLDRVEATLYLKPNTNYDVAFPELEPSKSKTFGAANTVDIGFYNLDKTDPNSAISNFNDALEELSLSNLDIAFSSEYSKKLLGFWREQKAQNSGSPFIGNYIHFACANALLNNGLKKTKVYEYFLDSAQLNLKNPELGIFVNQFFNDILSETDRLTGSEEVQITINLAPRAFKILELLKTNDYLSDLKLRELVALFGLYELFGTNGYNKANILDIVQQIGARTIYPEVRTIADNVGYMLRWLKPGFEIPEFTFSDLSNGAETSSHTLKGTPTVYFFWAPWSERAVMELMELKQKQQYWKDAMNYVVVLVDGSESGAKKALELVPELDAKLYKAINNPQLMDKLQIHALPHLMFVDAEGKLVHHYASDVSELERQLAIFFRPKR